MSLAEELLADLEDGGEDIAEMEESDETKLEDIAEEVEDVSMQVDSDKVNSVHSIAKLRDSKQVHILNFFIDDYIDRAHARSTTAENGYLPCARARLRLCGIAISACANVSVMIG